MWFIYLIIEKLTNANVNVGLIKTFLTGRLWT